MVMMACAGSLLLLNILLKSGEIGLRGGEVARFQILRQLRDRLRNWIGRRRRGLRGGGRGLLLAGEQLLKRAEIALRLGEIARLKILAELLKVLLNLLEPVRSGHRRSGAEKAS